VKLIKVILIFASICSWGQQANYKFNNFGNRSILLSGNVTGSVSDIGLVYYNPARLTKLENTGFSFNAKAYQINKINLTSVFDEERQLENISFGGVPSMAGGTFTLFGERFGYSFLARRRGNLKLNTSTRQISDRITELFPDAEAYNLNASITDSVKEDWYGLTWAKEISENFSLGISAFASSYNNEGSRSVSHTIQFNPDAVGYFLKRTGFTQKSYGLNIKVGASYKLKNIDLGLNINVPYLEVYEDGGYNYNEVVSGVGTEFDVFYDYIFDELNTRRKEPFGLSIGAGIPIKKSKIHLNIDYVAGVSSYNRIAIPSIDIGADTPTPVDFNEERKTVFNFGIGGEIYINEKFKSYFGFSTDFNAFKDNSTAFDLSIEDAGNTVIGADFYHLSGGIDWEMSWASIILGFTYASGSSDFKNPFNLNTSDTNFNNTQESTLSNQRYQVIIGLEIPLIDNISNKNKKENEIN